MEDFNQRAADEQRGVASFTWMLSMLAALCAYTCLLLEIWLVVDWGLVQHVLEGEPAGLESDHQCVKAGRQL